MAMRASLVRALSSTRSLSRMSISAAVGAVLGELLAQDARADLGRGGGLSLKAVDVGKPKSEIDHFDGV